MIIARATGEDGNQLLLMILEPGNISKLELGQPIIKKLKEFIPELPEEIEFMIALCPDVAYLAKRVKDGDDFISALKKAMKRPNVYVRDHEDAEILVKYMKGR